IEQRVFSIAADAVESAARTNQPPEIEGERRPLRPRVAAPIGGLGMSGEWTDRRATGQVAIVGQVRSGTTPKPLPGLDEPRVVARRRPIANGYAAELDRRRAAMLLPIEADGKRFQPL